MGRSAGSLGQEKFALTTGIDLAVWTLDSRLSDDGSWPLLIGLRLDCEWSVAALKFESPEGDSWTISRVEPKLLKRSHEIFLDTIHDNTHDFIGLTSRNADSVDIHLSGMVDGEPIAAKPANTIYRELGDSEEWRLLSSASSITRSIKSPFPLNDSHICSNDFRRLVKFLGHVQLTQNHHISSANTTARSTPLDEIVIVCLNWSTGTNHQIFVIDMR